MELKIQVNGTVFFLYFGDLSILYLTINPSISIQFYLMERMGTPNNYF